MDIPCIRFHSSDSLISIKRKMMSRKTAAHLFQAVAAFPLRKQTKQESPETLPIPRDLLGAANQIRTGDLVLTKDVLCLLSHSSR